MKAIEQRSGGLSLKSNIYLGILLRNFLLSGEVVTLRKGRAEMGDEKRVPYPLSLTNSLRKACVARAKRGGGTFTALLEYLVDEDLKKPAADLVVRFSDD